MDVDHFIQKLLQSRARHFNINQNIYQELVSVDLEGLHFGLLLLLLLWLVHWGWFFWLENEKVLCPVDFVFGLLEDHISEESTKLVLSDGDTLDFLELFGRVEVHNGSALEEKLNGLLEEYFVLVRLWGLLKCFGRG